MKMQFNRVLIGLGFVLAQGIGWSQTVIAPNRELEENLRVFVGEGRTYLGVGVVEIDAERSKALKLREEFGVEVTKVEEDSPAAKAGLKTGDVVLEYNGQRIEGTEQFVRFVRETPPGRTVKLTVSRGGASQTISPVLAQRKAPKVEAFRWGTEPIPPFKVYVPDVPQAKMSWRSSILGIEAEALEAQLANFFGVKEGVLVRAVTPGTVAEKSGLKAGDVLIKVDDARVGTPRDVTTAIRNARAKDRKQITIQVMREKKEVSMSAAFEDEPAVPQPPPPPPAPDKVAPAPKAKSVLRRL